jgi:hypothetical protein
MAVFWTLPGAGRQRRATAPLAGAAGRDGDAADALDPAEHQAQDGRRRPLVIGAEWQDGCTRC